MDFTRRRNGAHGGKSIFVVVVVVVGVMTVVDLHGGRLGRNENLGERRKL